MLLFAMISFVLNCHEGSIFRLSLIDDCSSVVRNTLHWFGLTQSTARPSSHKHSVLALIWIITIYFVWNCHKIYFSFSLDGSMWWWYTAPIWPHQCTTGSSFHNHSVLALIIMFGHDDFVWYCHKEPVSHLSLMIRHDYKSSQCTRPMWFHKIHNKYYFS